MNVLKLISSHLPTNGNTRKKFDELAEKVASNQKEEVDKSNRVEQSQSSEAMAKDKLPSIRIIECQIEGLFAVVVVDRRSGLFVIKIDSEFFNNHDENGIAEQSTEMVNINSFGESDVAKNDKYVDVISEALADLVWMLDKHYTFKKDTQNWPRMFIKSIEWETPIKIFWYRIRKNLIAKLIKKRGSLLHENLDKLLEKLPEQIVFKNQERPTIEWSKEQNSCDLLESCVRINMETVTELHSVFVCKKTIRTKIEDWFRSSLRSSTS